MLLLVHASQSRAADGGATFRVGGYVTGFAAEGLVLQNNGRDDLAISSNGQFTFATALASGAGYSVTVKTQPTSPDQKCEVAHATGTIASSNITNVRVTCTATAYTVGGTVSGLLGSGLVLQNNGSDDVIPGPDGRFTFGIAQAIGGTYSVSVKTQPTSPSQTCVVTDGSGTISNGNVTNVLVTCANTYLVGGTLSGLLLPGLVLTAPGEPDVSVNAGATTFAFPTRLIVGSSYTVTVKTQPPGQLCTVQNGSGAIATGDVTSISVRCRRLWKSVAAGCMHSLGLTTDGTLWAWGLNDLGQLGDGTTTNRPSPVQVGANYVAAAAGVQHTVALKSDGTLWAWGRNDFAQLGDGTTTNRLSPVRVGTDYAAVAALSHTMAVKKDGTLWGWGNNGRGYLGDGTTTDRLSPVHLGSDYIAVAAGEQHTAALKTNGTLSTWGGNFTGQLGDGTQTDRLTPTPVYSGIRFVTAGFFTTFAITNDGTLMAWGAGASDQLGNGAEKYRLSPVQVGTGFASVATFLGHAVALKSDRTLWVWGSNRGGQLGDGTTTDRLSPVQIGIDFIAVAAGCTHTVVVKADNTLWTWGENFHGQLGDGTTTNRLVPAQVP